MTYEYDAELIRVIDGDTVILRVFKATKIDFGFHIIDETVKSYTGNFRLVGIDAPETRGKLANKKAAQQSKERLTALLTLSKRIIAKTFKDPDSFGRYLVELFCFYDNVETGCEDMININQQLVTEGHAIVYSRR